MRRHFLKISVFAVMAILIGGCHASGTYTQTFVNSKDDGQTLQLTSQRGLVRPATEFPHNILFKIFGTDALSGTYVLAKGTEPVKGTFVAGKDGDRQCIKFSADGRPDWQVTSLNGQLVGQDDTVWQWRDANAKSE